MPLHALLNLKLTVTVVSTPTGWMQITCQISAGRKSTAYLLRRQVLRALIWAVLVKGQAAVVEQSRTARP
jgi:hypothetical protein